MKKGPYGFPVCGSSNAHVQSLPVLGSRHAFLLEAFSRSENSKGSGETALMRRLTRAFAGRLYEKYPFLMCWLICGH